MDRDFSDGTGVGRVNSERVVSDRGTRGGSAVELLVGRCRRGDQAAWTELIQLFSPVVWTVARSFGLRPADCEDVCQLAWVRVVEHVHQLQQPAKVGTWIVTVAKREAMKLLLLRSGRQVPVGDGTSLDHTDIQTPSPEETVLAKAQDQQVLRALRQLPERHQALLSLLLADPPLSYDQISYAMAIPRGSIGPTRNRMLQRMRYLLTAEDTRR